jgi:hypothetical protein
MATTLSTAAVLPTQRTRSVWTARTLTGLPVLFLGFDAAMKLISHPEVIAGSARLGLPGQLSPVFGAILAACVALYVVPRTAVLGAVLLTGYLGGAVLVHLRVGDPLLTHTLFPIYVATAAWLGLYLRDARVRALLGPKGE